MGEAGQRERNPLRTGVTEEDTFNALRREPWRKVMVEIFKRARLGTNIVHSNVDLIKAAGWDVDEFSLILEREIEADRIHLDVMKVGNEYHQRRFLETGII